MKTTLILPDPSAPLSYAQGDSVGKPLSHFIFAQHFVVKHNFAIFVVANGQNGIYLYINNNSPKQTKHHEPQQHDKKGVYKIYPRKDVDAI